MLRRTKHVSRKHAQVLLTERLPAYFAVQSGRKIICCCCGVGDTENNLLERRTTRIRMPSKSSNMGAGPDPSSISTPQNSARPSDNAGSAIALTQSYISSASNRQIERETHGVAEQFTTGNPLEEAEKEVEGETPVGKPPESRFSRYSKAALFFLQDQWFIFALMPLIILASQVQVPAAHQQTKETAVTYAAVALIFFITGCTLPTRVLFENYSRWKIHLFVQIQWFDQEYGWVWRLLSFFEQFYANFGDCIWHCQRLCYKPRLHGFLPPHWSVCLTPQ